MQISLNSFRGETPGQRNLICEFFFSIGSNVWKWRGCRAGREDEDTWWCPFLGRTVMSKAATAATKMSAVAIVASVTQAIMLALSTRRHKLTAVHVWLDNNNSPVKRRTLLPRRRVFIFVWNFFFKKRKKRKEISNRKHRHSGKRNLLARTGSVHFL